MRVWGRMRERNQKPVYPEGKSKISYGAGRNQRRDFSGYWYLATPTEGWLFMRCIRGG